MPIWVISGQRKSCTDQGSTTSVELTYDKSDTAPTSKNERAKRGHKDLGLKQPGIFVVPCCAHQYSHSTKGQLILSDYLAVNEEASVVAEQATDLIHWILSHDRVRKIFDDAQPENNFVVLVYPLANITRSLWHAAYLRQEEIIEVQLGREQNRKAVKKITETDNAQCNLLENTHCWPSLQTLVDEIIRKNRSYSVVYERPP
ncbi:hypothetical protein C8J57DRAFT_1238121 [Mycena rebaudengoi]|nr:hypothetical protein C8J57DRAFT_1238121 [Mycena rebaudengoi]